MAESAVQATDQARQSGAGVSPQFRPMLFNAHAAKSGRQSLLSHLGMNFNLSSFVSYYPMLRFMGYGFEAGYSPTNRKLQKTHWSALEKEAKGQPQTFLEKMTRRIYGDGVPETNHSPIQEQQETTTVTSGWKQGRAVSEETKIKTTTSNAEHGKYADHYKTHINYLESAAFTALAAKCSYNSFDQLLANSKLAVAAELGKDPKDVSFLDLRRSNNPIVVSAVDRFMWQTPMRIGAGLSFIPALWTGIVANSLVITMERTIFYRPLAYDILSKAINDVQINSLGVEAKGEVVDNLIRVMQAQRFDHRQAMIPREQVQAIRPTLEQVADDIINKRFGISGLMYIMGGGVLIPEDPAQSQANYQHVREVGVSGVMEEAKRIRRETHVPSTKIWDARLLEGRREKDSDYIAESARRDELLRERRAILARGPLHAMPGSEIDPTARYGSGVQMY